MKSLETLPNLGNVLVSNLHKADINTPQQLQEIGSKEAFVRIRLNADHTACLNMLYALEGAIQGIRWHLLTQETKIELKNFYHSL